MKRAKCWRIAAVLLCVALLSGCKRVPEAKRIELPADFALPDKAVYSVGEATHGSVEFNSAKQAVFAYLVREKGVRAFALEADFGNCLGVNDFIRNGEGSAYDCMKEQSFWVYHHPEMVYLFQWMHDYNQTAAENDKIRFYGFDMQQCTDSKTHLLAYIQGVDEAFMRQVSYDLNYLTDGQLYNADEKRMQGFEKTLDKIEQALMDRQAEFVAATSPAEYAVALELLNSLRQCIALVMARPEQDLMSLDVESLTEEELETLAEENARTSNLRDQCMAERVQWILEHEKTYYGRDAIFITGHNAHITKDDAWEPVDCMGERLDTMLGKDYYAIGTDFARGSFNAYDMDTMRMTVFTVDWQRPLRAYFGKEAEPVAFEEMAMQNTSEGADVFGTEQGMNNVGAGFTKAAEENPKEAMTAYVPARAYDSLLFFQEVQAFHIFGY